MKVHFYIFLGAFLCCEFGCIQKVKTNITIVDPEKTNSLQAVQIDTTQLYTVNSKDTLQPVYLNTANFLWDTYVPKEGQATTLQGELIRSIEKLEHEIAGNGKINWNEQHVILGRSLRDNLVNSGVFPSEIQREIWNDIDKLIRDEYEVCTDVDVYDRLTRRIVEWYWRNKEPVKRKMNPKLKI
jgi:hypothetical protein